MDDLLSRPARFEALFREHHGVVQAYARRRVRAEVVDDVVSETFLVAWRRLDNVPHAALPWLLAVARNVAGTQSRGATRRQRLLLKAQSHHIDHRHSGPGEDVGGGQVLAALATLGPRDREALMLVAWDGLTPAQAAASLGEPPERFRQRLHRAGKRVRAQLDADPGAPPPARDHAPNGGLA